jgi:hypothetical protein
MRRLLQRLSGPSTFVLLSLALACGGVSAEPEPSPEAVSEPGGEAPSEAEAPEPAGGPLVDAERMARIADGHEPLRDFVVPARGLVYVLYATDASGEDPRADEDGIIRLAEHWCTEAELSDGIDRLQRDLARRARDPIREPLFECVDDRCSHPAQMEYDVGGHYEFARIAGFDGPALIAVEHVESASMTEAFLEDAEVFVRDERAALAGATCD